MAADAEDWLLKWLYDFASLPEEERDAALDALPPIVREGLLALANARAATADANLIEVLDAGQAGLEKLYELSEPADLFAVVHLAVSEHPNIVIEALFAAVVLHRGWGATPAAMEALREQWHWHVHSQITEAQAHAQDVEERG
jgi:hypothetical protein